MYKTGDVYIVRFHPSFGSELKRFRPAVIVSTAVNKADLRFTLVAPLTSNTKNINKECEMLTNKGGFLDKSSVLLLWYLRTVDVERLERKIGELSGGEIKKMSGIMRKIFK
ncbi:type II toxin-antitoxin system PemK/MazF family toxin [Patescibacteria group bacterium]|nr:type II toxin-antitoxin system PemK/MazF family toxin [Patescibacteria group bacterium]MBU1256850.1 type II toxin-antitoxin system PemK/MazF family toxin [Patescibacteria group bacterium]MBU1457870.1 type II toxin-antitoxin system PemK/MazF family toxin [Patescibacteria group bacterium]